MKEQMEEEAAEREAVEQVRCMLRRHGCSRHRDAHACLSSIWDIAQSQYEIPRWLIRRRIALYAQLATGTLVAVLPCGVVRDARHPDVVFRTEGWG